MAGFLGYVLMQQMQSNHPLPVLTAPVFETTDAGLEGFVYRQTEEGQVQWEVEAQKAESHESEQHVLLKQVQVRLFDKEGQEQEMQLEAEEGTINTANGNFDLRSQEELIAIELGKWLYNLYPARSLGGCGADHQHGQAGDHTWAWLDHYGYWFDCRVENRKVRSAR